MAGCGYVCPKCEGREFLEDGTPCDWCMPVPQEASEQTDPAKISQ